VRSLVVLLLLASASPGADLRKLDGSVLTGEVMAFNDKAITIRTETGMVAVPVTDVLSLDLIKPADLLPLGKDSFADVELVDGSLLHVKGLTIKGKSAELTRLSGPTLIMPMKAISHLVQEAHEPKMRQEWQTILGKRTTHDLVAIKAADGVVNALEGTLGDADDKGETIDFELSSGRKVKLGLARVHGLAFVRKPDADSPPTLCTATDVDRSTLAVAKIGLDDKGFTITTPAGVKVDYPKAQLARLDFSRGKLTYLSDLEPVAVKESSTEDRIDHYRRDKNLDNGPLTLARHPQSFAKGLALHAYTELVYDVGGEYKKFEAVLGVDDLVGGNSQVRLTLTGDGRELFSAIVKRKDEPKPIAVDIKGVKKLRIEVRSADLLDLGNHLDLADAKVTK
jgi:hypothetical protein